MLRKFHDFLKLRSCYVDSTQEADLFEAEIYFRNIDKFDISQKLDAAGILNYTIDENKNSIILLDFSLGEDSEFETQINTFINEFGDNCNGKEIHPCRSSLIDGSQREEIYSKWLESGSKDGSLGNYISQALQRVKGLQGKNGIKDEADAESVGSFNAQKTEEKTVEPPKVEETKVEEPKVEYPKPEEKPKVPPCKISIEAELQSMDALGNTKEAQEVSEKREPKKKQKSVEEILKADLTESQIKRYKTRIEAINAFLEGGRDALTSEQQSTFDKLYEYDILKTEQPE